MKKFLFSTLLIGAFAAYVFFDRQGMPNAEAVPMIVENRPSTSPAAPAKTPVQTQPAPQSPSQSQPTGAYRDGAYVGIRADAYYGNVQVKAVIQNGQLADVQFLDHPQDRNQSIMINNYAMPRLTYEAIQAQSAKVNAISGATLTSRAFVQSLTSALALAKN